MIWHLVVTKGPTRHRDERTWDVPARLRHSPFKGVILAAFAATSLTACSVHPIPDDVSPIPTEVIVGVARCELRLGLIRMVNIWLYDDEVQGNLAREAIPGERADIIPGNFVQPEIIGEPTEFKRLMQFFKSRRTKAESDRLRKEWEEYLDSAVAYDWTFDITETNNVEAGLGFKLPFVNGNLDANTGGSVTGVREGKRTFKSQDRISNLLTKRWDDFCNDDRRARSIDAFPNQPVPRPANLIYPITGTIGLAKAVESFMKIAAQEGGLDTFTDELTFTTTISANAGAGLTLTPVPKQFRLVSANASLAGTRVDIHKVKVSLAFPKARPKPAKDVAHEFDKAIVGGIRLNPAWRASYSLCVVEGRSREQELKQLRLDPPEVTCLASTDAFFERQSAVERATHQVAAENALRAAAQKQQRQPGTVAPLQKQ